MTRAQAMRTTLLNEWVRCSGCGGDRWREAYRATFDVAVLGAPPAPVQVVYLKCVDCPELGLTEFLPARALDQACWPVGGGVCQLAPWPLL